MAIWRNIGLPFADWLSVHRITWTILLFAISYLQEWKISLMILCLAWLTDLLDGWAAKRYGSIRDIYPGLDMDGICDSVLAFGSSLRVVIYGWYHYSSGVAWSLAGLYVLTAISGIGMVLVINRPQKSHWMVQLIAVNMIVMHGLIQIFGTAAWFAYMAFGAGGVVVALMVAIPIVWLQRSKMQLWMNGKLA